MKILSMAPTRISLFGGGTDVAPYCDLYGGLTINMAINLYQKLTMYSGEDLYEVSGENKFPYGADPKFYYHILDQFGINDMHHTKFKSEFDGLIESGIGSSASAAVAMVGAINRRLNLGLSTDQIAYQAWNLEVNKIGLYGGKQDQYAAAFGGVNVMEFKEGNVAVHPLAKGFIEPMLPYLCLFYTGENRKSAVIQEGLRQLTPEQTKALDGIKQLALDAIEPIAQGKTKEVAQLMNQAWELKKQSNKVTNERIDLIYKKALKAGALAGKVLGAGGGGFMLFICPMGLQATLKERMKGIGVEWWDFAVDWNGLIVRDITNK